MKRSIYQLNISYSDSDNIQHFHHLSFRFQLYFGLLQRCTSSTVLKRESGNIRVLFFLQFEVEMLRSQVQVVLVALFSSVLLVQVNGAPSRDMLTLRADLVNDKVSDCLILQIFLWLE